MSGRSDFQCLETGPSGTRSVPLSTGKLDSAFASSPAAVSRWAPCGEAASADLHQCGLLPTLFPTDHAVSVLKWESRGTEHAPYPACLKTDYRLPLSESLPTEYMPSLWNISFSCFEIYLFLLNSNLFLKSEFWLLSRGIVLNYVSKLLDINIH